MAAASGINTQISSNLHKSNCARISAESGLEIIRYWIDNVSIASTTPQTEQFNEIAQSLKSKAAYISNVTITFDSNAINIPSIILESQTGQNFSAVIIPSTVDPNALILKVTGNYGSITKSIGVNFRIEPIGGTAFNYGVASKGPVSLQGNVELDGVNIAVESNVYIESENSNLALSIIGSSSIAGDVSIVNPSAYVDLQGGHAEIGGETGQDAIDNHVQIGVAPTDFPTPNPNYFRNLVTLSSLPASFSSQTTFENLVIPANRNPSFSANITLRGLVLIESPNRVTFNGNVDIAGIIVGNGNLEDNSKTNSLTFSGSVTSSPVSQLSEAKFDALRNQSGTFVMAPGFAVSFGGNFHTLNGAIAANGIDFYGNAGGTINGSVLHAAVARRRVEPARLHQLALPRPAQPAAAGRVAGARQQLLRHGDLLRRRQGHRRRGGPRPGRPEERLRHRLPPARPGGDAAPHRAREEQRRARPRVLGPARRSEEPGP